MRIASLVRLAAVAAWLGGAGCAMPRGSSADAKASGQPATPAEQPAPNPRYSTGRAMQDFRFPSATVTAAVLEAMEDLNMKVTHRDYDGPASQIDGRTADGRSVAVTLRPNKPITRVSCRIGWFGDEPLSRALLRRIGVRLGTIPPEAIPDHPPSEPASNPFFSRDAVPNSEMMREFYEAPYRNRPDM
jgi:Protein of unknown function (DUF3568)